VNLLILVLMTFTLSPADSCWKMVTVEQIPERAILFARLAARDGGSHSVDLGTLLELAGRFREAAGIYEIAICTAEDPLMSEWLTGRLLGCEPLDTTIVLAAILTNQTSGPVENIRVEIPLPESHPPYQHVSLTGGVFQRNGDRMQCVLPVLPAGTSVSLPVFLHLEQEPYTYRPLQSDQFDALELDSLMSIMFSLVPQEDSGGNGPCLGLASDLRDSLEKRGLSVTVTGGLVRVPGDSLLFHAWNHMESSGIPLDASLFHADSMRSIAHCPTDMIPLWNLDSVDGHEVSAYYRQPEAELQVSMRAFFADEELLDVIRSTIPGRCLFWE
jgi:hypothetical protein